MLPERSENPQTGKAQTLRLLCDIETDSTQSKIWVVCCREIDSGITWAFNESEKETLNELLKSAELVVGHNFINFDRWHLQRLWGIQIPLTKCFDTLIVSRLLNPNMEGGHSLENWGKLLKCPKMDYVEAYKKLVGEENYHLLDEWDSPDITLLRDYCLRDCEVNARIYLEQLSRLQKQKFSEQSVALEHEVADIVGEQIRNGVYVNERLLFSLTAELTDEYNATYALLCSKVPPKLVQLKTKVKEIPFNPGSRQQIVEYLKSLGWKPTEFTEKGNVELSETILEGLVEKMPEAKVILRYFLLQKRISELEGWIKALGPDGRIHGNVITNGAITGRATHSNPNLGNVVAVDKPYGKECRSIFTVPEGKVLVGCDLSGIELRCLAHYMKDDDYANEVVNGDVHTRNQLAARLPTRNNAKTFIYAFLYGAGAAKIGSIVGGSAARGSKLIEDFLSGTPKLMELKKKIEQMAEKGSLPGLDGRRLWVRSAHSSLNMLLQSAGAIVSKQWMVEIKRNLTAAGIAYKQVLWVHDEVEVECDKKDAELVAQLMVQSANECQNILGFRVRIDAEAKIGTTWADVH